MGHFGRLRLLSKGYELPKWEMDPSLHPYLAAPHGCCKSVLSYSKLAGEKVHTYTYRQEKVPPASTEGVQRWAIALVICTDSSLTDAS